MDPYEIVKVSFDVRLGEVVIHVRDLNDPDNIRPMQLSAKQLWDIWEDMIPVGI